MRTEADESAVLALEGLVATGTVEGLAGEEWTVLAAGLEGARHPGLAARLAAVRAGTAAPESILDALDEHRRGLVAALVPPRMPRNGGGDREARLAEIAALAGAPEPSAGGGGGTLATLAALAPHRLSEPVARIEDVRVLWCLLRTGRVSERRAAMQRLGALLVERDLTGEGYDERDLIAALTEIRDPRIAFELDSALAGLPGAAGRGARHRLTRADRLLCRVEDEARRFWSGDAESDPLDLLVREEALRVGVWLRRGSDILAAHVAEHLRGLLGRDDPGRLSDAVGALIPSGDARLLPVLARVLSDGPLGARVATARALARIADPRVHPVLVKADRHATDPMERVVLGGALGQLGDRRALPLLLDALDDQDSTLQEEAIRALGDLGDPGAAPRLSPLLGSHRPALVRAAAVALVRCGDRAALDAIRTKAAARPEVATLLLDAAEALALRLQLTGALPRTEELVPLPLSRRERGEGPGPATPAAPRDLWSRIRSATYVLVAILWATVFQRERALSALAVATRLDPSAARAHLREAVLHAGADRDDLAIEAYRRAVVVDRNWVLARQRWVQRIGRTFVRRADFLVARRRRGEALALLDELGGLDLGRADLDLRLAVSRRRDKLLATRSRPTR